MPELPEIETIKRELKPRIINQKIIDCIILRSDIIGYPKPKQFCSLVIGERISDVIRRGKYLILQLTNNKRIVFHLRLSGALLILTHGDGTPKFARVMLKLSNFNLIFEEPRVLGRVYVIRDDAKPWVLKGLFTLGYEPISPEFDFNHFKNRIKNRKAHIKALLLDQKICAGVGNIYSDEALFRAGIRPLRRTNTLKIKEIFKLLLALKDVLNEGIENFGTTVSDYKRTNGKNGNFQKFLYVYSREDKPCHICNTKIRLTKIGNRSTRFCPRCQK